MIGIWIAYVAVVQALAHLFVLDLDLSPLPRYRLMLHGIVRSMAGLHPLARWDSLWYLSIARDGYGFSSRFFPEQSNTAFFPLYPFLMRFVARVLHVNLLTAGVGISEVALLSILLMLYFAFERKTAVLLGLLAYPSAFILVSVYAESLFLALCLATYLLARREEFLLSFAYGFLAGLTRPDILPFVCFMTVWAYLHGWREKKEARAFLPALGGVAGVIAFMVYFQWKFGDAFLFFSSKEQFRVPLPPGFWQGLKAGVGYTFSWTKYVLREPAHALTPVLETFVFAALLVALGWYGWKRRFAEATYVLVFLGTVVGRLVIWGIARRAVTVFPAFEFFEPLSRRRLFWMTYLILGFFFQAILIYRFAVFNWGIL